MRVRCIRLLGPTEGSVLETSSWFTVGREYVVLEIASSANGPVWLRMATDPGDLAIADSRGFVTTDPTLPPTWTAAIDERGMLVLAPARWHERGLWERYYDGEAAATVIVDEERDRLVKSE